MSKPRVNYGEFSTIKSQTGLNCYKGSLACFVYVIVAARMPQCHHCTQRIFVITKE